MPSVILASYGNRGIAERADGTRVKCVYRRSVGRPYCGDQVLLEQSGESTWVVCEILPRRNIFVRADNKKRKQVVASNLDRVCIVISPRPAPSRDLVERYLVAVHSLGIEPLLVINKVELLSQTDRSSLAPFSRAEDYRKLGYDVIETSCKGSPGVEALLPYLKRSTSILVGQSGVGKSSLVNRLIPDLELQTGALSRSTGKGIHTTTTTIMYAMPDQGWLIDSPGVWEYGLWEIAPQELAAGFPEFAEIPGQCRFNDCRHNGEPDCVITAAAVAGEIYPWRFESYLRLLAQST